ncbi:IS110 family transposase, partial [Sutterella massiliensis]|nr:IS110 family transposase [Sutterella massiliensis]
MCIRDSNGDRVARTYVIQGAASIYMQNCKNQLPECQLRRWLEEQIKRGKPYGKIIVSLAAKLLRIVWALLTYKEKFHIHKAGVPRSVLAAIERPQESTVAAEAAA